MIEEFIRRIWLDLTGAIPPVAEARRFLADTDANKREKQIDHLADVMTMLGVALPAFGSAIYGIRLQGNFADLTQRSHRMAEQLAEAVGLAPEDLDPDYVDPHES